MKSERQTLVGNKEQVVNSTCPKNFNISKQLSITTEASQVEVVTQLTKGYETEGKKENMPVLYAIKSLKDDKRNIALWA